MTFIITLTLYCCIANGADNVVWFDRPADAYGVKSPLQSWKVENPDRTHKPNPDQAWEKYALPVGNGFIGAMIYGGIAVERIQFNEHSLWSGGPGSGGWTGDNNKHDAYKYLPEIRKALLEGDTAKAQKLSAEHLRGLGSSDRQIADITFGRYQTFGELTIATGHDLPETAKGATDGYMRMLDLSRGVHTVRYPYKGAIFTRESFCSNPDRCLVVRFGANQPALQNLKLKLASPHNLKTLNQDGVFVVAGKLENNGLKLETRITVLHKGGTVKIAAEGIEVGGADDVTFILVAGTDYAQNPPLWRGHDPAEANAKHLQAAIKLGFDKLRQRHIEDHKSLFGRVAIDLGSSSDDVTALPTDQRVARNKKQPDIDLEELYFQFGRYLLIASSRPGGLPANLQGIWCNEIVPAWNSDYHLNINLQMNYWPSGPCNLLECQEPLIKYTDMLRGPGAVTAKAYNNTEGWTAHLSSNIWGRTVPHPGKDRPRFWAYFPLGGAWLTTHAWEQYAFGGDVEYLRDHSWEIIAGTADFLVDYLYELPTGELSSTPSWSPEHGPISLGTTADIAMAHEALDGAIAAADVLGISGPKVEAWKQAIGKLVPYKIGKHGQLQEWYEDIDKPNDKHRHLNHLFGLHPGTQISPVHTPKLAAAAKTTLTQRGDGATGWSMGWKINFWARIHDGDHAYLLLRNLLSRGTNPNLFDVHPPFQIDGNFGGCAGIAEMLMQSHYRKNGGEIYLLTALPKAWPTGSVKGLRARGGFTVDIKWKDEKLVEANIKADKDSKLTVRCNGEKWEFDMLRGKSVKAIYAKGKNPQSPRDIVAKSQNQDQEAGLIKNEEGACQGYTLFSPIGSTSTYLIDMEGRIVNEWQSNCHPGQSVYLLENGHLLRTGLARAWGKRTFHAGGAGGRIQEFTWKGELLWDYKYCNEEHCLHHDIEPLPNGTVLMIAWEYKNKQQALDAGRDPDLMTSEELWPDHIIEVKPAGKTSGKIVWEWHVWDHLVQDYDKRKANFAVVADHPELVDINYTKGAPRISSVQWRRLQSLGYIANTPSQPHAHRNNADWNHTNSISYNAKLDQIALSVHGFSEVWVIDHSTTTKQASGHSGGRNGKGGDILYRWGNPQAYRSGTRADQQYFVQHDVSWIMSDLPEAVHLLAFNNGLRRPGGNYSSIDEIILPLDKNGRYIHKIGTAFGPTKPIWTYTAEPKNNFYSGHISGVQRLSNGNTLICSGEKGRFFEVTSTGKIVWEYINPVIGQRPEGFGPPPGTPGMRGPRPGGPGPRGPGPGGPQDEGPKNSVFKLLRYGPDYPGLAGQDLTPGKKLIDLTRLNAKNKKG